MKEWIVKGKTLEFIEDSHTYVYDGEILPSVTQIMNIKFGNKYKGVNEEVLNNAAKLGTAVHKAIEDYYSKGVDSPSCKELRNMKFLQKLHKFEVLQNEVPIVLFLNDKPIAAGQLDLVLKVEDELMLGDIKRTSALDKEYLAYQLNLYKIGFEQCYGKEIKGLRGLHLREDVRKFVNIPVNENMAWKLVHEYLEAQE